MHGSLNLFDNISLKHWGSQTLEFKSQACLQRVLGSSPGVPLTPGDWGVSFFTPTDNSGPWSLWDYPILVAASLAGNQDSHCCVPVPLNGHWHLEWSYEGVIPPGLSLALLGTSCPLERWGPGTPWGKAKTVCCSPNKKQSKGCYVFSA